MAYGYSYGTETLGGKYDVGAPDYMQNVTGQYAKTIEPSYKQALERVRQSWASRGGLNSGMENLAEMQTGQEMAKDISGQANQAAVRSAEVAEARRRAEQQRNWTVEDREKQYAYLREVAKRQEDLQNAQQRAGNIRAIGSGVGTVVGMINPIVGGLIGAGSNLAANQMGGSAQADYTNWYGQNAARGNTVSRQPYDFNLQYGPGYGYDNNFEYDPNLAQNEMDLYTSQLE